MHLTGLLEDRFGPSSAPLWPGILIKLANAARECDVDVVKLTVKVDGPILIDINSVDHSFQLGIGKVLAHGAKDSTDLAGCYLAWN